MTPTKTVEAEERMEALARAVSALEFCAWNRKWRDFNAFTPGCSAYLSMYGKPPTGVPLVGQRYCAWCGKPMRLGAFPE